MKQNILFLFAMVLFCTANAYAQLGKDCISAATICGTAQIPAPTAGGGDITDAVPNDCGVSEHNSTWVTFVVTTSGTLSMNFDASPNADIDFALWRIPGGGTITAGCAALTATGTNDRCDYDSSSTESGFGTTCGWGWGCDPEGNLTVSVGDRIIAMVDDFGSFDGFAFTPTVGGTSQRACNTVKCNSCASPTCTGSSVYANYAAASGDPSAGCNTDEIRIPGSQIQDFCMTFTTPATLTTNEIAFDAKVSRIPGACGMAFTSETLYSNACGAITSSGTDAASGFPKFPVAPSTTYKYCMTWTGTSCTQIQNPCFRPFYSPAPACVTPTPGITNNEAPASTVITCANPGISVTATGGATYAWSGGSTPSTAANTFTSAGTYTVTVTAASGGATCTATASITITGDTTPTTTPTFAAFPATICSGGAAPSLPATSDNGVAGTWSPSVVSNTASGTYTFTPNAGQCATTATVSVTVTPNTTPTFAAFPATICSGGAAPSLPATSDNGVAGTWSPSVVSNTASGTYTFTPNAGQCATTATVSVTVTPNTTPTFAAFPATICSGGAAPSLPATSDNGVAGTWSPSVVSNTASGTYTFTPNAGQCATTATVSVTVTPNTTPTFAAFPATICSGGAAPSLPATSDNGVAGTWSPSVVSNTASGTYTFTPNAGQCATTATVSVTVTPNTTPTFAAFPATICSGGAAPSLPATSDNGVAGTWSPSVVSNTASGTYTFTPNAGQCATTATVSVTVNATPSITSSGANLCSPGSRTLAATPSGGTFSVLSGPGSISGTTLTASGIGAIVVQYSVTVGGCTGTTTQTITTVACTRTITITDPCSCNNDATVSVNGTPTLPVTNGTFDEVIGLNGLLLGDVITVNSITGLQSVPGTPYTPATAAAAFVVAIPAATLSGVHTDNVGYTISVHISNTVPGSEFEGDLVISNKCAYPNPNFSIGSFVDCNTAMALTTVHSAEGNGTAAYSGTGVSGTNFTPTGLTGAQTIALTYTGINNGAVSPDSGTTPAFPGCQEVIQKSVTVNCPACQASPNMQWGN